MPRSLSYHSADLPERTYAVGTFFVYFVYFVVTTPAADPPRIWYNADIIDDSLGSPLAIMICRYVVFAMRRQKKPGTVGPRKQDGDPERMAICDYCGSC